MSKSKNLNYKTGDQKIDDLLKLNSKFGTQREGGISVTSENSQVVTVTEYKPKTQLSTNKQDNTKKDSQTDQSEFNEVSTNTNFQTTLAKTIKPTPEQIVFQQSTQKKSTFSLSKPGLGQGPIIAPGVLVGQPSGPQVQLQNSTTSGMTLSSQGFATMSNMGYATMKQAMDNFIEFRWKAMHDVVTAYNKFHTDKPIIRPEDKADDELTQVSAAGGDGSLSSYSFNFIENETEISSICFLPTLSPKTIPQTQDIPAAQMFRSSSRVGLGKKNKAKKDRTMKSESLFTEGFLQNMQFGDDYSSGERRISKVGSMRAKIVAPPPMILITFAKHCALFTIDGALLGSYGVPLFPQQPPVNLLDVKVIQTYYDSFYQQGSSNSLMGLTLRSFSGTSTGPSVFRPYIDVYDGLIPLIPAQSQPFQVGGKLRERMHQLRKKGGNFGISAQVERQLNMSMQSSQNATMISQTGTPSYNKTSQMLPSTPMQPQTDRNKEDNSTTLQGRQSDKIDLTIQTQNKLRNTENMQSSQTLVSRTPNKMLDSGMQMPSIQMPQSNDGDYIPTGLQATQKGITVQTHLMTPTELLLYRRKQMLGKSSQQSATPPSLLVVD